ncbi:MAG: DNA-3-methyladenine glycosylase I [Atopostipes suicloacalis]|nr:DNA-3-methyladenine glycosylase I [Atopostipes suicloacalis]MDN6731542.1 DNA-3-methyladenine glycosylase I [Atopostipes suicloacalis]
MVNDQYTRCQWIQGKPDYYIDYHDRIWGKIVYNDQELFKWLSLEIFHIGLSWQLVLSKYHTFMEAFDAFDFKIIATYDEEKINRLMENKGIIRYRKKIEAVIHNAQKIKEIQKDYGSFYDYIWSFTDGKQIINQVQQKMTHSQLSDKVSKDLKDKGFKFIGSVTIYSYLQAIGVINAHDSECDFR